MKSTHEPFDDELRRRLLNYTEEPNRHIWHNILPRIDSFNPEPRWVVWITRLSVLVIGLSGIFFLTDSVRNPVDKTFYQTFSGVTATDSSRAQVPFYPPGESVPGKRNPDLNRTVNGMPAGPSKQQEQLTSSLLRNASGKRENLPVIEETDPALAGPEDLTVNSGLILQDPATARAVVDMHTSILESGENRKSPPPRKQESDASKKTERRRKFFSLYFTAMPTLGYQRIKSNNSDLLYIAGIERIPAISIERLGVRLEAGAEVPLSKRWKAFGGILYYQRNQTIGYIERVDSMIVGSGGNYEPQFEYLSKSIEYELKNAGLQVGLSYQLRRGTQKSALYADPPSTPKTPIKTKDKFLHEVGAGIEFHKSLRKTRGLESAEGFTDPSTYVFLNMYYRLQYPNAGRLRAIFQPTLNYSFYINENLNAPFYVKPYGLGLNFGCKYHFR